MNVIEWVFSRAALDPDAFSCAVIVALLLIMMILTAVVYGVSRAMYIKLWRRSRRKGKRTQ